MGRLSTHRVDVAVVGGGVQGLCIAIEVARSGRRVAVLDRFGFDRGASHGNAGLLCPSYVTPIASPRALLAALGWILRGEGPFALAQPPWQPAMAPWLARFLLACCSTRRSEFARQLADLAARSIEWYADFAASGLDFGLQRRGWLYVYATPRGLAEGLHHAGRMRAAGVVASVLSADDARRLEPALERPAGAVHYPGDAHLNPDALIAAAVGHARALGVELASGAAIEGLSPLPAGVRVKVAGGEELEASHAILACGAETAQLARTIGAKLAILPARGHSATLSLEGRLQLPLLLSEAHLVITPMSTRVRMTGGLELGSREPVPDGRRLARMASDAGRYLAKAPLQFCDPWVGFRPLTPDGIPIVGALAGTPRIIVASGHGTLGMTLAPATACAVRRILDGGHGPTALSPGRFGA